MRQTMGQTGWLFGTGEVDNESQQDELWNKTRWLLGQEKMILSHREVKYGTYRGHFLGQEKLTYGHDRTNFGTIQGFWDRRSQFWVSLRWIMGHKDVFFRTGEFDIWVITRWILGHNKCVFLGQEKLILGHHEMNYGTKQDHFLG